MHRIHVLSQAQSDKSAEAAGSVEAVDTGAFVIVRGLAKFAPDQHRADAVAMPFQQACSSL